MRTHEELVRDLNLGTCKVVRSTWPYDCKAKDLHPDDEVFKCVEHSVWWHRPPAVIQQEESAQMKVRIKRDGKELATVENASEAMHWLHQHTSSSYDHALKYEGYTVEFEDGTPALTPYSKAGE